MEKENQQSILDNLGQVRTSRRQTRAALLALLQAIAGMRLLEMLKLIFRQNKCRKHERRTTAPVAA